MANYQFSIFLIKITSYIKSEKECYRYNSIYKLFINALTLDPPQPPFLRGEPGKSPLLRGI